MTQNDRSARQGGADTALTRRQLLGAAAAVGVVSGVAPTLAQSANAAGGGGGSSSSSSLLDDLRIPEPYPPLHGGRFLPGQVPSSPDPLVRYRWSNPRADDGLQVYQLRPRAVVTEDADAFRGVPSAGTPRCLIEVRAPGSLRVDFGVESPAWLEFDSPDLVGTVEMSVSEYNRPARVNPGPEHPVKTLTPERVGNTYRLKLNAEYYEGVRFGWIHVRDIDQPWRITGIRLVCQAKPANYVAEFSSSDPRLDEIWYAGAYSARVGFQADHFGAILMDRGDRHSWAGDCYPHQATAMVAFGNDDFVRENLIRTATISNGIEIYAVYWVLSLLDYYQQSGDTDTFRDMVPGTREKLDHADTLFEDPRNMFYGWDERLGAGFEAPDRPETKNVFRATFIQACSRFANALDTLGEHEAASDYRARARSRTAQLRGDDPSWFASWGIHALSEAVTAGVVRDSERDQVFKHEFADRLNRVSFSPFNQYFVLQAMTGLDRVDEALQTVDDCWGGQLDYGGTTYFEVFRPDWVTMLGANDPIPNSQSGWTSLAHPWSSGVTAWLSHDVLGIRPTTPGYHTFDFAPRPGRRLDFVEGSMPTPFGTVSGRFDMRTGQGRLVVPAGTTARVLVPKDGRRVERVRLNRRIVWDARGKSSAEREPARQVTVDDIGPGTWEIDVTYVGDRRRPSHEHMHYPMRFLGSDRTTSGDWGGRYGSDGYVLFSYDAPGQHREVLPDYVGSVTPLTSSSWADWSTTLDTQWAVGTDDRRALAPDPGNGTPRNAGVVYSRAPAPGGMTMVVDIEATPDQAVRIGLYFVDFDSTARRLAVEIFDLETRKLLAPEQLIDDFHDGVYLRFACDRPVRLRVAHVLGANAVLSGVFFDPL